MLFAKGTLLIADPGMMGDVIFSRSIVLLTDFNQEGAVGFVLNKPSKFFLDTFFEEIKTPFRIYVGGPVEEDHLYYIHKRPDLIKDSVAIAKGIYWGGNFDTVIELAKANKIRSDEIKFFLGYSGWAENQLEEEVEMKAWILFNKDVNECVFSHSKVSIWKKYLKKMGDNYSIWANIPENPQYN